MKYKGKRTSQDVVLIVFSSLNVKPFFQFQKFREEEENNLSQMKKLFFLYVWLNLTRIAELRKEDLVKEIK